MTGVEACHHYWFSHSSISFIVLQSAYLSKPSMAGLWLLNSTQFVTIRWGSHGRGMLLVSCGLCWDSSCWAFEPLSGGRYGSARPGDIELLSISPPTGTYPQLCGGHTTFRMVVGSYPWLALLPIRERGLSAIHDGDPYLHLHRVNLLHPSCWTTCILGNFLNFKISKRGELIFSIDSWARTHLILAF